jgi:hypothetical protein
MSWLVDNAFTFYVILGVVAVGLLLVWRNNRQTKYLAYTAGVLVLIGLVWLATQFYVSDSKQLENNVNAMADAVIKKNVDDLFKHISKDFRYRLMDRDAMYARVKAIIGLHEITDIRISSFHVDSLSRAEKFAKTSFLVTPNPDKNMFRAEADFVLEGDQWKLKTLRFFMATGGQEIEIPGLQ